MVLDIGDKLVTYENSANNLFVLASTASGQVVRVPPILFLSPYVMPANLDGGIAQDNGYILYNLDGGPATDSANNVTLDGGGAS